MPFPPRQLGRTGVSVGPLGLAASYGAPAQAVQQAFDHGINYLYWGSMRRDAFAQGLRPLLAKRTQFVLVVQSYSRVARLVPWSLERALRRLGTDYADVLLLGLWNHPVSARIMEAAQRLQSRGLIHHIALSTHQRTLIPQLAATSPPDIFHVRYNAKHRGAESEVFPHLDGGNRPGIVSFTATSWKQLIDPKRTPAGERTPTACDCYRFVLTNPSVDVCMSAPATLEQAADGLRALKLGPMQDDEMAWMRRVGDHLYGRKQPPL